MCGHCRGISCGNADDIDLLPEDIDANDKHFVNENGLDDINESWNDEGIHLTGMEEIV